MAVGTPTEPAPGSASDRAVAALAARHPLILRDVQEWIRLHPEATRFRPTPARTAGAPAPIPCGRARALLGAAPASAVADLLAVSADGATLWHIFPQVSQFLHFLAQGEAAACAADERWTPLLLIPLEHAAHAQRALASIEPRDWPWALLDRSLADPEAADDAAALGRQMLAWLEVSSREIVADLERLYADHPGPAAILRERGRPLKVLALAYEGSAYQQFCARDVAEALSALGVVASPFVASTGHASRFEVLRTLRERRPDVLLLNGRSRAAVPGLPRNLAVLSWDQDYALACSHHYAREAGPRDRLMLMVADWVEHAADLGVPRERLAHVNAGVNHRIYHPPAAPIAGPEFDVLFVGNIYPFDEYRRLIAFDSLEEGAQRLMLCARQRLAEHVLAATDGEPLVLPDCDAFLRRCLGEMGLAFAGDAGLWRFLVHYFRYRVAHHLLRELYVTALADLRLGLFGRNWDKFPALARHARPEAPNGEPLRELIHRSAINLHLHTWTVHHPRLYDTAAAGGFLLVGRVDEAYPLSRAFAPGEELETFGSISELRRKVRRFLDRPDERAEMAARAARRAAAEHTMERRMADALAFLAREDHDDGRQPR